MKSLHYIYLIALLLPAGCSSTSATKSSPQIAPVVRRSPTPRPTVNLSAYPIKLSNGGKTVEIKVEGLSPDFIEGPLQVLSAALTQNPKSQTFKMNWDMSVGSSWGTEKVLYDRPFRTLKFDDKGGMGNF
jgi:hypothetical protein